MGQSIDCQPHFGHQVGRKKASYANHAAQVGEKTAVCLLSDRLQGSLYEFYFLLQTLKAGGISFDTFIERAATWAKLRAAYNRLKDPRQYLPGRPLAGVRRSSLVSLLGGVATS
jgi:hypothetical protein